jgi:RNA polymerase sigma factor (TIGR02999 family)
MPATSRSEVIGEITKLLLAWSEGDRTASEVLLPMVYAELSWRARSYLRRERPGHSLQTVDLVHETLIRLSKSVGWKDRNHFFGTAATIMRHILVEYARKRRGGVANCVSLGTVAGTPQDRNQVLIDLEDALERLAAVDPRKSKVVELRYFGGLTIKETADVLGVSVQTVNRDYRLAMAWLRGELAVESGDES